MSTVGQIEKQTQARVVKLFQDQLGYDYLGNWIDRVGNANIEPDLLRPHLVAKGYAPALITKAIAHLSELLDALIAQRKTEAIDYEAYLAKIVELTKQAKSPETTTSYPVAVNTPAKRALYDNLGEDESLALVIDAAIRSTKKDAWRGNRFKEKEVRNAIKAYIADPDLVGMIFDLVRNQNEY